MCYVIGTKEHRGREREKDIERVGGGREKKGRKRKERIKFLML